MNKENQSIEADFILEQKNWTGLSFLELARAGRVLPVIAKELAERYLIKKYERLKFDLREYQAERKSLIEILEEKISAANNS